MRPNRLAMLLVLLAGGLAANALLGPAVLGVIDYRYGASMTAQGVGLDVVAMVVAVPLALASAVLARRGRVAGSLLGMGPAAFAAYMAPQYVIGPDYAGIPGNNERFFPLHLALLLLAFATLAACWSSSRRHSLPTAHWFRWGAAVVAGVILLRWFPLVVELSAGRLDDPSYREDPTAFFVVAMLDLGVVVPAALVVAVALVTGRPWAGGAFYVLAGWFCLVPLSVAAMAVSMLMRDVPGATTANAVLVCVLAVGFVIGAGALYRPVLRR